MAYNPNLGAGAAGAAGAVRLQRPRPVRTSRQDRELIMDTYAIVKTGGKQYRVEPGQRLLVERLPDPEGAEIQLETLMLRDSAVKLGDDLGGATVTAKILGHERGEKLRVFKFKPKRGYKRRTGHRQDLTRIEVTAIGAGKAKRSRAKKEDAADGA